MSETNLALNDAYTGNVTYSNLTGYTWWPQPIYQYVYPSSMCYACTIRDKGKQAFEIAKHLAEKKIATPKTIKDFIDLVDVILKEL